MPHSLFLILTSAVLYGLCFPPFSFSFLIWGALVPFFVVIATVRPCSAAGYGVLWGVIMTCSFGWSFPQLVANYFGLSLLSGWGLLLVVSLVLFGVYFGAFAFWLSWCSQRRSLSPWLVAAGWGTCEFARANIWVGNPLALAGYSQVSLPPVIQIADFSGPYGIGLLIAAVNAGLAGWLAPQLQGQHWRLSWIGITGALSFTFIYGTWRLWQTFTSGDPIQVAIIQGAIPRELRGKPAHWDANLTHYLALTRHAVEAKPALIFWPENAVAFPLQQESVQQKAVLQASQDFGAELILGGPYFRFGVENLHNRNAVFVVRDGKLSGRYDKLRLVPFAEQDWFGWFRPPNQGLYEPGQHLHLLRTTVARIGTFVCFEAVYPDLVRHFTQKGAQILANPSNDDWFGHAAPAQHLLDIARVRAIENRRYIVRPTTTGFSAVIDPYGGIVVQSGFGSPEVIVAPVATSQAETFYQRWGDMVAWGLVAFSLSAVISRMGWRKTLYRRYGMRRGIFLLSCVLILGLILPPMLWAGGAGNGVPAVREALLAHICTAGPNTGQPCTVSWSGSGDLYGVVSEDCPGACVIDYESGPFEGDFFVIVDEDVTAPAEPETALDVPIVTALLCVEKKKDVLVSAKDEVRKEAEEQGKRMRHCFTESYRPAADGSFVFGGVGLSPAVSPEEHVISSAEEGLAMSEPGKETMLLFWKFGLQAVLTPESDLTQALRDFYKKTGVVTVTDLHRIGTDDHVDDTLGSVLRFRMTLRFVKAPLQKKVSP